MLHLLIATTNQGKVDEIKNLLKSKYLKISSLSDFPEFKTVVVEETGDTFFDNALIKAQAYGRLTGLTTLADDSGLSVLALNNRPGVYSNRYGVSDKHRNDKLLAELKHVKLVDRQARFTCSLVLYDPSSDKHYSTKGVTEGFISVEPKGNNGFGFDPVFFSPELGMTFAEASKDQKNLISHRGKALDKMIKIIAKRCR